MPSPHFDRRAREILGDDAGQELGEVMDRIDPVRGDFAELRHAMAADQAAVRKELVEAIAALRTDMTEGFAGMGVQMANMRADVMKWSFGFWVGAVLAIAALAGVLRWTR